MLDCDDNWVKMAMADDTLVANFLLRLNNNNSNKTASSPSLNLHWTVRQRRSRRWYKKSEEPARASPTTPLSWSAATSASAAGSEDSTRPTNKPVDTSRSKVDEQGETATANKRSRKKRTLHELLEEEKLLLKERRNLKDELESLHLTVEKQRATNENLKRIKLDWMSKHTSKIATISLVSEKAVLGPPQLVEVHCDDPSELVSPHESLACAAENASPKQQEISNQESSFLLPDLNMPVEEELTHLQCSS